MHRSTLDDAVIVRVAGFATFQDRRFLWACAQTNEISWANFEGSVGTNNIL